MVEYKVPAIEGLRSISSSYCRVDGALRMNRSLQGTVRRQVGGKTMNGSLK